MKTPIKKTLAALVLLSTASLGYIANDLIKAQDYCLSCWFINHDHFEEE